MSEIINLPTHFLDAISNSILPYKHSNNIVLENIEKERKIIICIHKDVSKK